MNLKKLAALLLAVIMILPLAGCGKDKYDPKEIGRKIISGEIKRIVLAGDSITDGFGGFGYNGSSSPDVSTNTEGYCWANLFKKHLADKYGCEVVNRAVYSVPIDKQLDALLTGGGFTLQKTDFVIWMTGSNNRLTEERFADYRKNLRSYVDAVLERTAGVLFVTNIPSAESYEKTLPHTSKETDEIAKSQIAGKTYFISGYQKYIAFCKAHNIDIEKSFIDRVHPNSLGYYALYATVCDEIGLPLNEENRLVPLADTLKAPFTAVEGVDFSSAPVALIPDYDRQSKTTIFSGRHIKKITVACGTSGVGTFAVGKIDLNAVGTGTAPKLIDPVVLTSETDGLQSFDVDIVCDEHETLGFCSVSDTKQIGFSRTNTTLDMESMRFMTADGYKTGTFSDGFLWGAVYAEI